MEEELDIIKEQIQSAPEEIKKLVAGNIWNNGISIVSKKNNLSQEQIASLEKEVLFVILGMELYSDFAKNIQRELAISEILANDINIELFDSVFRQIINLLPKEKEGSTPSPNQASPEQNDGLKVEPVISSPIQTPSNEPKWWDDQKGQSNNIKGDYKIPMVDKTKNSTPNNAQQPKTSPSVPEVMPEMELSTQKELPKSFLDKIITPEARKPSVVDEKLQKMSENEEGWGKRKTALDNIVIKSSYTEGQDPYREPLQ
jgi:hypothetical protein